MYTSNKDRSVNILCTEDIKGQRFVQWMGWLAGRASVPYKQLTLGDWVLENTELRIAYACLFGSGIVHYKWAEMSNKSRLVSGFIAQKTSQVPGKHFIYSVWRER